MTFNGYINVKQTGHAIVHVDAYGDDYLIPMPSFQIKGFLSGKLYPEIKGTYHIVSSTGFVSKIVFSGQGVFSGKRNSFFAKMYRQEDIEKTPIYTIQGQWTGKFVIHDCQRAEDVETYDCASARKSPLETVDTPEHDPWETRSAWESVIRALKEGDMQAAAIEKSKLEMAQREMRKREAAQGTHWTPLFFSPKATDPLFTRLASEVGWELHQDRTNGVWRADREKIHNAKKPYHASITPLGKQFET